jgi:chromosome segregation ATPase
VAAFTEVAGTTGKRHAREGAMSMYFLDDTDDWPEYQTIRDEIHRLEREHLELSRELEEIESGRAAVSTADDLAARIHGLRARLKDVQRKLDESLSMYR